MNVVAKSVLSAQVNTIKIMTPNLRLLYSLQEWRNVFLLPGWSERNGFFLFPPPWFSSPLSLSTHSCLRGFVRMIRNLNWAWLIWKSPFFPLLCARVNGRK